MLARTNSSSNFSRNNNQVPMDLLETDDFTLMQPSTWEGAALLKDDAGFELPTRYGSRSPATANADPNIESIDFMTQDMRTLVRRIQDLRHLGIEDSKIALPKICVVGDQSTGKSSLIEGMSEIKVPRSAGTCTRCPMEINLSDSDQPWKCSISLTRSHTFSTKQSFRKATKSKPLGPWIPDSESRDEPFIELYSKDQVQDAIKRAQLAILNPQNDPATYLPGSSIDIDNASTLVKFSPNVVRLDITAPNFPNLSFYDLPGVISQTEVDDEAYLVTIVENLVRQYVSQDNCIILLTLPMTDDATNSSAARIVREIQATHRTLGVLTKPDRVEDISQWTDLLTGQKFRLGHGYYVVRNNPNPAVEHRQARIEEAQFFTSSLWAETLAVFASRLGTRNLQNALSQLLLDQIKECLPRVITQIREKAREVDKELSFFPEPVNQNTLYILCSKLQELKTAISASMEGGSKEKPMLKIWNQIAEDFSSAIQCTRPTVHLLTEQENVKPKVTSDDDNESSDEVETPKQAQTPKRKAVPEDKSEEKPDPPKQTPANHARRYYTEHFQEFQGPKKVFNLLEIRGYNEDWSTGGLHNQINPKAVENMNKLSVEHWEMPMKIFIAATYKRVKSTILEQVNDVLSAYQETELHRQVTAIVRQYLVQLKEDIEFHAAEIYTLEMTQLVSRDRETLQKQGELHYGELKKRRREIRAMALLQTRGQGQTLPQDRAKIEKFIDQMNLSPDQFDNEVKMMATTRAYYKVASSRFVDNLCMAIQSRLFLKCKDNMYNEIELKLGIREDFSLARCAELLADDPERQRRREFLVKEREKLALAQRWLDEAVKRDSSGADDDDAEMDLGNGPSMNFPEDDKMNVFM